MSPRTHPRKAADKRGPTLVAMDTPISAARVTLWMPPSAWPSHRDRWRQPWVDHLRSLGADVAEGGAPPLRADAALRSTAARGPDPAALCRQHRDLWPALPLLLLGRFPTEADRIVALESGADECLGPDCTPRELLARVRAMRRRLAAAARGGLPRAGCDGSVAGATAATEVRIGDWLYRPAQRCLAARNGGGHHAPLSPVDAGLLDALTRSPGQVVARQALLHRWVGTGQQATLRAVDTAVMRLRRRVEPDPAHPRWILSVRGQGYCYVRADGD